MRGKVKIVLIIFVSLTLVYGTSIKEVTAKESKVSSSHKSETLTNIQENNKIEQLNISTDTANKNTSISDTNNNESLDGQLWKDNKIQNSEVELTEEDKNYLFMILGELYYGNGMPYNDEMKLDIANKFIYEHEFMYNMFSDGNLSGSCHIPIEKLNELLLNTINTKIDDYSKCTNLLNNENNTNKDVVVFSAGNRGDNQPIVKIKSILLNLEDANTVTIEGKIAHTTEFKAQKVDDFRAVAKINPSKRYGMLIVTNFKIQEKNAATNTPVINIATSVPNNNKNILTTITQNNNSKSFSTGDIFNMNYIIIIVLSSAIIICYRKKQI